MVVLENYGSLFRNTIKRTSLVRNPENGSHLLIVNLSVYLLMNVGLDHRLYSVNNTRNLDFRCFSMLHIALSDNG